VLRFCFAIAMLPASGTSMGGPAREGVGPPKKKKNFFLDCGIFATLCSICIGSGGLASPPKVERENLKG